MGDLREPNGVVLEDSPVPSSSSIFVSSLGPEVWVRAEQATREIIRQVQPTVVSEERRRDVIDYVQRLLKGYLGCEVFPFGSVPLKTYLPDGDIDLTAFCGFNLEEGFANDVYSVLEGEDHNPVAEFVVKDVQYIRAEVKLVKCLVQNIVVDISFNQIGGLCALCFLEEVDRLIGKDHLFKRSIILIKAWCYYESRILGAHHGLISTYALETLVLYIFHLFHSSLSGPLAVLYKFLDYFSKFDWENYCVSLSGPVHVSSLPEIVAERLENGGGDMLLSDDFMRECVKKFSVPSRGPETNFRGFMPKHLNIVDPLKENNNLGRSVSKGNFFRIRSAFSYGARKLGQILLQPRENIAEEVRRFFTNTLDRHGQGQRPDVQDIPLMPGCNDFPSEMLLSGAEPSPRGSLSHEVGSHDFNDRSGECRLGSEDTRFTVSNVREPGIKNSVPSMISPSVAEELSKDEISSSSASRLSGDANDLATCGVRDLRITNQSDNSSPSGANESKLSLGKIPHAPHLYFSRRLDKPQMENGDLDEKQPTDSSLTDNKMFAGRPDHTFHKENGQLCNDHHGQLTTSMDTNSHLVSMTAADARCLQDSHSIYRNIRSRRIAGSHETMNLLPDLSGDVDSHLDSLGYGRWWYDCDHVAATMPPLQPIHLPPAALFHGKNHWDAIRQQPVHFRRDMAPHVNVNGVIPRPAFFPMSPPLVAGAAAFSGDEMPKPRGTGTYFPIMQSTFRDRSYPAKGRTQGPLKSPRTNGRAPTPLDRSPQAQSPIRQGVAKPRCFDSHENSPRGKVFKEVNGFVHTSSEKANEFVAVEQPLTEAPLPDRDSSRPPDSSSSPGSQNGESVFVMNNDRYT